MGSGPSARATAIATVTVADEARRESLSVTAALFRGLSAFPLTPADADGVVDTDALGSQLERLVAAGVDSVGLLGSTGTYAYLDRSQRGRAVAAAVECLAGRAPLMVGIGALRTSWVKELAADAQTRGADALLLAPMSYTPLTQAEVAEHFRAVARATRLPICIYNNPTTTNFRFSVQLLGDLATERNIAAVKMPLPTDGGYEGELRDLRERVPGGFAIGYSGDWGTAPSLLAGADAFFSVLAGVLPKPMLKLARAAQAGRSEEAAELDKAFAPMWSLFREHGGLRVVYAVADLLGLSAGEPPAPIRRLQPDLAQAVDVALQRLQPSAPA